MPDLSKLTDADLNALEKGDYGAISDAGLAILDPPQSSSPSVSTSDPIQAIDYSSLPKEFLRNLVSDAGHVAGNTVQAILHPLNTAKTMGSLVLGGFERSMPAVPGTSSETASPSENVKLLDSVLGGIKASYGSMEGVKKSAFERPVQTLLDATTVIAPLSKVPGMLGQVAEIATEPLKVVSNLPSKALRAAAEGAYRSSVSFPESVGLEARNAAANAGLDSAIPVNTSGIDQVKSIIGQMSNDLDSTIARAEMSGATIPLADVIKPLQEYITSAELSGEPVTNIRAAERIIQQQESVFSSNGSKGRDWMTPSEAQTLKKRLNAQFKYNEKAGLTYGKNEALSALRRGVKGALDQLDPAIPEINSAMQPYLDLKRPLMREVLSGRTLSEHPFITGGAGRLAAQAVEAPITVGSLLGSLVGPRVRARAGILMNQVNNTALKGITDPRLWVPAEQVEDKTKRRTGP